MTQRPYSDYYQNYKATARKAAPKTVPPERARQDVLSVREGVASAPKDFDWLKKNIPCQFACPAQTDIPGYLAAIARGEFDEAYKINLRDNVFPAVLGRVCTRPCEPACRHGQSYVPQTTDGKKEPVAICFSKRSASDFQQNKKPVALEKYFPATGKHIAVIGAGAAGLAAARELALLGHRVTVFEKHKRPGGLMILGIPHFRLPRETVEREVGQIRLCGVEICCGVEIGRDVSWENLIAENDAVILAAGTAKPNIPDIPGNDLRGVRHGLRFLFEANEGEKPSVGKNVVVIGGGFTAVDCARTARRLGAETVRMVYRRSREEMYITPGEVEEMLQENIAFETNKNPVEFVGENGRVTGVKFVRTRARDHEASDSRRYENIPGSEEIIPCDAVLLGTGQTADSGWVPANLPKKVFIAGDFATGAKSLIDAIAHGKVRAWEADEFLMGFKRLADAVQIESAEETGRTREMDSIPRQPMPGLDTTRRGLKDEVETGFGIAAAKTEASRCYLCHFKYEIDNDLCIYCDRCLKVKPVEKCIVKVSSLIYDEQGRITGYNESKGSKDYNMLFIDQSQCIRCGACKEVCPVECISLQKVGKCVIPLEKTE